MPEIDTFQISQKLFIVNGKQELLVLKNAHIPFYDFPGGRLDKEEFNTPLLDSLRREVVEEIGRDVALTIREEIVAIARECLWNRTLGCLDYDRHVFIIFYEAQYRGGEIVLSDEHESYQWVECATFKPEGLFKPGIGAAAEKFLRKRKQEGLL